MYGVKNCYGIKNARAAVVRGVPVVVTHRDPKSGMLWCETIDRGRENMDSWYPADEVSF